MNYRKSGLTILMALLLAACGSEHNSHPVRGGLVDDPTEKSTQSIAQVDQATAASGLQILSGSAKCDVRVVQLNYYTAGVQPGEMTNASAALLIPSGTDPSCQGPFPLIAFARGTELAKRYTNATDLTDPSAMLSMAFYASQGYAVVATDYLGYALSNYPYHPYMHANSEASAVIDSIRAARNAAKALDLTLNGKIMVSGFSQGGHASMATQRAIESDNADEFNLVAAAHLAGSYDMSGSLIDGITNPILGVQYFMPYEITALQKVYGNLYDNVDEAFNAPYASYIEQLFPVANYPDDLSVLPGIATAPADAVNDIFNAEYLADIATNPDNATIIAERKQDLLDWNPKAPTNLCGGSSDPVVNFSINTQAAYDIFRSHGWDNVSIADVDATIEAIYGGVRIDNPATYYRNYHSVYQPPLCTAEAKKLFDQYK
jgi:pimeloyl-ACP methyl ester carboxylesterase